MRAGRAIECMTVVSNRYNVYGLYWTSWRPQHAGSTVTSAGAGWPVGGRDRDHAPELAHRFLAMSVALGGHLSLGVDIAVSASAGPPSASGPRGQPHDAVALAGLHLQPARPGHQ